MVFPTRAESMLMRLRSIALIAACFAATVAKPAEAASTRTWPGAAPCNTTLSDCIAAAADGDTVQLATSAEIDETVSYSRPVNLVAASGYAPVLAAGRSIGISIDAPAGWQLVLDGLRLRRGAVSVLASTAGSVSFDRLRVDDAGSNGYGLSIGGGSFGAPITLTARVRGCRVGVSAPAGVGINVSGNLASAVVAEVSDNLVEALGIGGAPTGSASRNGILVLMQGPYALRADILRNRVLGDPHSDDPSFRVSRGIQVRSGDPPADAEIRVADNVVVARDDASPFNEDLRLVLLGDHALVRILNNSLIGADYGINFFSNNAAIQVDGLIAGNLIAQHGFAAVNLGALGAGVVNRRNAFFANPATIDNPGPGTITADPRVAVVARPRLSSDSPLRDAADAADRAVAAGALPALASLDVDGLRRIKGGAPDIGAYEFGDDSLVHNTTGFAAVTEVNDARSNGNPALLLQVSRSGGAQPSDTTPNPRPLTQRYASASGRWQLLADDGFNLNTGAGFHLLAPAPGPGVLHYVAAAADILGAYALLPPAIAALPPDSLVLVSPSRGAAGTEAADPHPVAATYQFGAWYVANLDGAALPQGAGFNVYAQPPSRNAFLHTVAATGASSALLHPELDGNLCAAPHIAAGGNGAVNPHPLGVHYDPLSGHWLIRNEDGAALAAGTQVAVLFEPKRSESLCNDPLFGNGFEDVN